MKILITNDDGVTSHGLLTLAEVLSKEHEVLVVAPESEQSAMGHAITIRMPLWVKRVALSRVFPVFATTGTPADCVKLGVEVLSNSAVDLVISGINRGFNLGTDIIYSGTVSGALEGVLLGIPSVAVSGPISESFNVEQAAEFVNKFIAEFDFNILPAFCALNINIPEGKIKGWRAARQSKRRFADRFESRRDPSGKTYYWLYGDVVEDDNDPEADYRVVNQGYASITPISVFLTEESVLKIMRRR